MNAPVIMSSPHFYQNPDELRLKFDGISPPDAEKHETRLYIEPTTGMTIKLHKRIQVYCLKKKMGSGCSRDLSNKSFSM